MDDNKEFKFGDVVYHEERGKGVFLGKSKDLIKKFSSSTFFVEVIFNKNCVTTTLELSELSSEPLEIHYVEADDSGHKITFYKSVDNCLTIKEGAIEMVIYPEDIDKFIGCLREFQEIYGED